MKTNTFFTIIFSLMFTISFTSCGAIVKAKAKKNATVERGAIPKDFGKGNTTMLFITRGKRSYDKYLERNIKKEYGGDYKLIDFSELFNDEYNNLEKYPYYFDFNYKQYQRYSNNEVIHGPGGGYTTSSVRQFVIRDRKAKKYYPLKMTSGFWSKLQRIYIKNMEVQRLKNQDISQAPNGKE